MAEQIDLPVTAIILTLRQSPIRTPEPWISRQERESGAIDALSTAIPMVSWWDEQEIRDCFDEANRIWQPADIRFRLVAVVRRNEMVANNERRIYVDLGNRLQRIYAPNIVAGFVEALSGRHGGIAGGHIALVAHRHTFGHSIAVKGTILAHELGHTLNLVDRVGPNDGNLMFHRHTIGSSRNRALTASQISWARRWAEDMSPAQ